MEKARNKLPPCSCPPGYIITPKKQGEQIAPGSTPALDLKLHGPQPPRNTVVTLSNTIQLNHAG